MREFTNLLVAAMEDGLISAEQLARDCLVSMSEDDVKNMFFSEEYDDQLQYEEEDDGDDEE